MTTVVLDTHAFAWAIGRSSRLTRRAALAIETADEVVLSTVSLFEIAQKARLGKWPDMAPIAAILDRLAEEQGARLVPATAEICLTAALLDWPHRDPFDRLIAATALELGAALVSADPAFDALPVRRIWA